jgi:hypothetical protein
MQEWVNFRATMGYLLDESELNYLEVLLDACSSVSDDLKRDPNGNYLITSGAANLIAFEHQHLNIFQRVGLVLYNDLTALQGSK